MEKSWCGCSVGNLGWKLTVRILKRVYRGWRPPVRVLTAFFADVRRLKSGQSCRMDNYVGVVARWKLILKVACSLCTPTCSQNAP